VLRALSFALLLSGAACTSVVWPPDAPAEPTTVWLLSEGMHVGLVLPTGDPAPAPGWVEYGFGEWEWYALGNDAWYRVFPVMLWPTAGTLCRREYALHDADALRSQCASAGRGLDPMVVGGREVAALRRRLAAEFARGAAAAVTGPGSAMAFVPADDSYWFWCTCADVAARWCRELGCTVGWIPIRGGLVVHRD
jgi:hypothetical protein